MPTALILAFAASLGPLLFKNDEAGRRMREILGITSPEHLNQVAKTLYQGSLSSPGYSEALRSILAGSNSARASLGTDLARRGLSNTGIGDISRAAGASLTGSNTAKLNAGAWEQAMQRAIQLAQVQVGGIANTPLPRNIGADLYAGGLDAASKYFLQSRKPELQNPVASGGGTSSAAFGLGGVNSMLTDPFAVLRGR